MLPLLLFLLPVPSLFRSFPVADAEVVAQPGLLTNRIVAHFQQLFDVRGGTQGIFPKMNELYVFVNEMLNFTKDLRTTLGLDRAASINVCLATVRTLVAGGDADRIRGEQRMRRGVGRGAGIAGGGGGVDDHDDEDEGGSGAPLVNYVVDKPLRPGQRQPISKQLTRGRKKKGGR